MEKYFGAYLCWVCSPRRNSKLAKQYFWSHVCGIIKKLLNQSFLLWDSFSLRSFNGLSFWCFRFLGGFGLVGSLNFRSLSCFGCLWFSNFFLFFSFRLGLFLRFFYFFDGSRGCNWSINWSRSRSSCRKISYNWSSWFFGFWRLSSFNSLGSLGSFGSLWLFHSLWLTLGCTSGLNKQIFTADLLAVFLAMKKNVY